MDLICLALIIALAGATAWLVFALARLGGSS